ncbi:hypothetical protein [Acidicapsa acidisoli]|uniref:hypothetical protein n=1 Tax=Acidicapsa acidisoli TaxID=1615681 RepID=UPI0021E0A485|nr:hypothetical protein [Acidicapsa acidisoli]
MLLSSTGAFALALGSAYAQTQTSTPPTDPAGDTVVKPSSATTQRLPAEMPATPPKVTCTGGQLTIVADNSTMSSVFAAIHGCIGAAIDLPPGASSTRMFADLGPGPVNQVLQSLLSSTDLDYVIQLSSSDSSKIQAVLLTARVDDKDSMGTPALASTPARRAWLETRRNARHNQEESDGSSSTDSQISATDTSDPTPVATPIQDAPVVAGDAKPEAAASAPVAQPGAPLPAGAAGDTPGNNVTPANNANTSPADPNATPAADSNAAVPPDPSTVSPADKETQDKITNMEQLFEKRKQMIETQSSTPKLQ